MESRHNISQNTLSFLVEKIFDFKVYSCELSELSEVVRRKCVSKHSSSYFPSKDVTGPNGLNLNILQRAQYFIEKYKHVQYNVLNILAYNSGILDNFFQGGTVPLTQQNMGQT